MKAKRIGKSNIITRPKVFVVSGKYACGCNKGETKL